MIQCANAFNAVNVCDVDWHEIDPGMRLNWHELVCGQSHINLTWSQRDSVSIVLDQYYVSANTQTFDIESEI